MLLFQKKLKKLYSYEIYYYNQEADS